MSAPKVYLAGPDIFRKNAQEVAERQKAICRRHGLAPLHPMDNNLDLSGEPAALRLRIFRADVAQMLAADAICANMNEFLGADPDSGTCFEVGFFAGLNAALAAQGGETARRPIYGYVDDGAAYHERIARWRARLADPAALAGWRFSTIDMHINLMMEMAMASDGAFVTTGFEDCIRRIAADLMSGRFGAIRAAPVGG
jgi:nucleoside 2-deoxyribosyltransferase